MRRVLTALVGIPLLILLVGWGGAGLFSLFVFLVTLETLCEYFFIAFPGRRRERLLGILCGSIVSLEHFLPLAAPGFWLAVSLVGAFSIALFLRGPLGKRYQHLGWTLVGSLYLGFLAPHFVSLYRSAGGREWVFFLLLVVMAGDTAAYVVGSAIGKRKLSPGISPGKTVEGSLGSVAASLLAGLAGARVLLPQIAAIEALALALAMNLLGQAGDLFESWIKRVFSVKDSAAILPGHGGLLDRIDSLIFPVVFVVYYLRLTHR